MKKTIVAAVIAAPAMLMASASAGEVEVRIDKDLLWTEDGREQVFEAFVAESRNYCRNLNRKSIAVPRTAISTCTRDFVEALVKDLEHPEMFEMLSENWNKISAYDG